VSGSRGFFYDNCRSADRLAREYTVRSGNAPVVYLDGSRLCYRWTGTAAVLVDHRMTLQSFVPSGTYELSVLFRKNVPSFPTAGSFFTYYAFRDINNYYWTAFLDAVFFSRIVGGVSFGTFIQPYVPTLVDSTWYNVKIRHGSTTEFIKWWQLGTAEPNWIYTSDTTGTAGGSERPMRKKMPAGAGYFGIGVRTYAVGEWAEVSDIRITPIRKVGGP